MENRLVEFLDTLGDFPEKLEDGLEEFVETLETINEILEEEKGVTFTEGFCREYRKLNEHLIETSETFIEVKENGVNNEQLLNDLKTEINVGMEMTLFKVKKHKLSGTMFTEEFKNKRREGAE